MYSKHSLICFVGAGLFSTQKDIIYDFRVVTLTALIENGSFSFLLDFDLLDFELWNLVEFPPHIRLGLLVLRPLEHLFLLDERQDFVGLDLLKFLELILFAIKLAERESR